MRKAGEAAAVHPDGYVEIRDRLKDVIISGGENISSVEVDPKRKITAIFAKMLLAQCWQKRMEVLTATLKEQASQIQKVSAQVEMSRPAPQTVLNNQ
jgi:long-subunit acyl-CoA synthetase (AMP-forming)